MSSVCARKKKMFSSINYFGLAKTKSIIDNGCIKVDTQRLYKRNVYLMFVWPLKEILSTNNI